MKQQAEQLIQLTCDYYQIDKSRLCRNDRSKPFKSQTIEVNGKNFYINLASLRIALSYYLMGHTNLTQTVIGPLCGYVDHSTLSYVKKKAINYINAEDYLFYPYWLVVNEIGKDLGFIKNKFGRVL